MFTTDGEYEPGSPWIVTNDQEQRCGERLRIQGLLTQSGPGLLYPTDVVPSSCLRAHGAAGLVAEDWVLCMGAATWLHGGPAAIECWDVRPPSPSVYHRAGFRWRFFDFDATEVESVHGVKVTTAHRTVLDLLLHASATDQPQAPLHWWVHHPHLDREKVMHALRHLRSRPNIKRAMTRWQLAMDGPHP